MAGRLSLEQSVVVRIHCPQLGKDPRKRVFLFKKSHAEYNGARSGRSQALKG